MTNRYVTEAEKAGQRRRQALYRARKKAEALAAGKIERRIPMTEAESGRMQDILSVWREEPETSLTEDQVRAAVALKP